MMESQTMIDYPPDDLYMFDWWAGWVSWMHWGGGECGGFHGYDKWIKGWHEGLTPHWLQAEIFRMLAEYPWFRTNLPFNGNTLEEMQRWTPDVVTELAEWVRQGRIEICDGTYDTPYLFLYPGESQIRQLQFGKAATRAALGLDVIHFAANEGTFHPQLAQILVLAGYTGVLFATPWGHYASSPAAKEHRILWEAPDGTRIDAIPSNSHSYTPPWTSRPFDLHFHDPEVRERFARAGCRWPFVLPNSDVGMNLEMFRFAEQALDDTYVRDISWYAPIDIRVPMREAIQKKIRAGLITQGTDPSSVRSFPLAGPSFYRRLHDDLGMHFTTLTEYLSRTAAPEAIYRFERDDFRFRHIVGSYGDQLTVSARRAESRLCDAEAIAVMAQAAGGALRVGHLDRAWKKLLNAQHFNNYCIPAEFCWRLTESPASRAIRLSDEAAREGDAVAEDSMAVLERRIDTRPTYRLAGAIPLVVFNALGWRRSGVVVVHVPIDDGAAQSVRCYDGDQEVPCQIVGRYESSDGGLAEADVAIHARDVSGFGYKVFHLQPDRAATAAVVTDRVLQNDLISVRFDARGHLIGCIDRATGEEFLDVSARLGNELTGRFPKVGFVSSRSADASAEVIESGPVRWALRAGGHLAGYPYETVIRLSAGSGRIDVETRFDFDVGARVGDLTWLSPGEAAEPVNDHVGLLNDREKLRTTFNPRLHGRAGTGQLFSDLAFAAYPSSHKAVLGVSWADYADDHGGLTLINTGNIGYYHAPDDGALLSLVLAYGGPHRAKGPTYLAGLHHFRYSLLPHAGDWRAARSYRHAAEVASPLTGRLVGEHAGTLPGRSGLIEIEPANVMATALIPGSPALLRVVEMQGTVTELTLSSNRPIDGARVVDLMGNPLRQARHSGSMASVDLRAHEICTIEVANLHW